MTLSKTLRNLFGRQKPDLDEAVLTHLRNAGSDLSRPHNIEFFLYFPTQAVADQAASRVQQDGFSTQVEKGSQGDTWLCFATKTMVPDLAVLQKIRNNFNSMAASLSGHYDGWGTEVEK
jgi:hypothetical protein